MPTSHDRDVIVVGAGFAGVTVARELSRQGHDVLVLEARDRIGGRTWTDERLGHPLELGGGWVHWVQPHVWAELTRYGIGVVPSPVPVTGHWITNGRLHSGSAEELLQLIDRGMTASTAEALTCFPRPYDPLFLGDELRQADQLTIRDKLEQAGLERDEFDAVEGMWATNFNGATSEGGYLQALRWCALAGGSWQRMFEACATYKIQGGTGRLISAMLADADVDVRLGAQVTAIAHDEAAATVTVADGSRLTAAAVVVTAPLGALAGVTVDPPLSETKQRVVREGQTSKGVKVWAHLRGELEPFVALAPRSSPFTLCQVEYVDAGTTTVVAFGPDSSRIDVTDRAALQSALRGWLPGVEVIDVACHDWVADPFAGETWPMQRAGQLTGALAELRRPEGRVVLAGSDYADGWGGFIDGAIESGLRAARDMQALMTDPALAAA